MEKINNYESKVLLFRDMEERDAEVLFKIYSDKEAMKYRRNPPMISLEDAILFISNQNSETEQYYKFRKCVELKEKQELIGSVMYKYNKKIKDECIIGYSIGRRYWGRGIGRNIVKHLLESLRIQGEITIVKAWIIKENLASKRVLEVNDFQLVPQMEFENNYLYVRGL